MNKHIQNIIAAAAEELGVNYQEFAAWYLVLIQQCLTTFKSEKIIQSGAKEQVEVYQNKAVVPEFCLGLTGIILDDNAEYLCPDIDYVIQGDTIIFAEDLGLEDGDKPIVVFKKLRTSVNNAPYINQNFERMLVSFIGWKHCRRFITDPNYPPLKMNDFKREYMAAKKGLM